MHIEGILDLAKESEHPRTYEVAGQLIKTVSETSEKLLQIQKMMNDLEDDRPKHQTTNQNLFVGSTTELQKLLKKKMSNQRIEGYLGNSQVKRAGDYRRMG